jgi:hypothetical protein
MITDGKNSPKRKQLGAKEKRAKVGERLSNMG